MGALPGGGSGWGDSRRGRSPVFGVTTEGRVPGLPGQVARGTPGRALCANSLGFAPACCVLGRDARSDLQVVGSSAMGNGGGSPGGGKDATSPSLGRNLEKIEWGQEGGERKEASAGCPEVCQVLKTQGQRMWSHLLFKNIYMIDVRTTQLTICAILLYSLLRKLLSPNPSQISFSCK